MPKLSARVGSKPVHGFEDWDFWWVHSSILVDETVFGRVRSSVFLPKQVPNSGFLEGFKSVQSSFFVD